MPPPRAMMTTRSFSMRQVEPSGMMISCPRTMAASRMPFFRCRSFRGTPRNRVLGPTVKSMASAWPSAMRCREFMTLPLEFWSPRTMWRM